MPPYLSVVLPFYNEEACVGNVVAEVHAALQRSGLTFELIAVQNGSTDTTADRLNVLGGHYQELRIVHVQKNLGLGYGLLQGLSASRGQLVGYMPGDGQVDPKDLLRLVRLMEQTPADVGVGRRVSRRDGWIRWLVSKACNIFADFLFRLPTDDINAHPKVMTRPAYSRMNLRSRDCFIDSEILLKAQRLGLKITVMDLVFRPRQTGYSKVRWTTCLEFVFNMLRARFMRHDPWEIKAKSEN